MKLREMPVAWGKNIRWCQPPGRMQVAILTPVADATHLFSAEGAVTIQSLGHNAPGKVEQDAPALKARYIRARIWCIIKFMPQSLSKVIVHLIFRTEGP